MNYRFIRVSSAAAGSLSACHFAEIEIEGYNFYNADTTGLNAFQCDVNVTINGVSRLLSKAALYADEVTPIINEVSPDLGSTAGGDLLTITGENLGDDPAAIRVLVDDVPCNVIIATPTEIRCLNGPR